MTPRAAVPGHSGAARVSPVLEVAILQAGCRHVIDVSLACSHSSGTVAYADIALAESCWIEVL